MPAHTIPVKFKSGTRLIDLNDFLSADLETEKSYTIKNSANREIYIYGIKVENEISNCLANFHCLNIILNEAKEHGFQKKLSLSLKKSSFQKANNFFFIDSYSMLANCKDLEFILNRTKDINSKCDFSTSETYSLYYMID